MSLRRCGRDQRGWLSPADAIPEITAWLERQGLGRKAVNYKLRDWLFSRQRYWGEPFPVIWVEGVPEVLPEQMLPVRLPDSADFKPTGTTEGPLANLKDWVNTTDPETGRPARRETNTMPQWAGSCWYYLRFLDPKNPQRLVDPARQPAQHGPGLGVVDRLAEDLPVQGHRGVGPDHHHTLGSGIRSSQAGRRLGCGQAGHHGLG